MSDLDVTEQRPCCKDCEHYFRSFFDNSMCKRTGRFFTERRDIIDGHIDNAHIRYDSCNFERYTTDETSCGYEARYFVKRKSLIQKLIAKLKNKDLKKVEQEL